MSTAVIRMNHFNGDKSDPCRKQHTVTWRPIRANKTGILADHDTSEYDLNPKEERGHQGQSVVQRWSRPVDAATLTRVSDGNTVAVELRRGHFFPFLRRVWLIRIFRNHR